MWKKMIELEQKIVDMRVELVKEYMATQGVDLSYLPAEDLLDIYSWIAMRVKKI